MAGVSQETISILIKARDEATKTLNKTNKVLNKNGQFTKNYQKRLDKARDAQSRLNQATSIGKREFQGWAMSIMFAGMAIQRAFMGVWKSGMKTFQEVQKSVEGSTDGFTKLQGSMKYLQFTIGRALEPIAELLIPIIDRVADWVSQNERLVATVTALGIAFGTLSMVLGMIVLAKEGFVVLGGILKSIARRKMPKFTGLARIMGMSVSATTIAVLGAIAALGAIAWKSFSETPAAWEAVKETFKELKDSESIESLVDSLEDLVQIIMPDFEASWENVAWGIAWAVDVGVSALEQLASAISVIVNSVMTLIKSVQALGAWFNKTFNFLNPDMPEGLDEDWTKVHSKRMAELKDNVERLNSSWETLIGTSSDYGEILDQTPGEYKRERRLRSRVSEREMAEDFARNPDKFMDSWVSRLADPIFRDITSERSHDKQTLNLIINVDGEKTTVRKLLDSSKRYNRVSLVSGE